MSELERRTASRGRSRAILRACRARLSAPEQEPRRVSVSERVRRDIDPSALSTRGLEHRLRQAALSRPGSALRLREREGGAWEAAFTLHPGHPVRERRDLPTWIAEEGPSKREVLLGLWHLIDERPELEALRRVRDRRGPVVPLELDDG
jgi:hypothetical protein